jgi:hypothetical protein
MRSYSFDINISSNKNSKKFNIKLNEMKMNHYILSFILITAILFTLQTHNFSLLVNSFTLIYSVYCLYIVFRIRKEDTTDKTEIITEKMRLVKSYNWLLYVILVSVMDFILLIFNDRESFKAVNSFEVYHAYLGITITMVKILLMIFIHYYFRDYVEKINQDIIDL